MLTTTPKPDVKIADEVWIATALLHRDHPERADFTIQEIMERVAREALTEVVRAGVYMHVVRHCVANRPPSPARYRILFETSPGRRRLFRHGDPQHPARGAGKSAPRTYEMPKAYEGLLSWYRDWCAAAQRAAPEEDPLLALTGSGKNLWAEEHADDYVRRLREGWE